MDLRPLFLIYFIVISGCFLFTFFNIVIEDEKELESSIKFSICMIVICCIIFIKKMYF